MTAWLAWATLVTTLLGAAALGVERWLRHIGRPGRFAWLGALGGTAALLVWALLGPEPSIESTPASGPLPYLPIELARDLVSDGGSGPGILDLLDALLAWVWPLATGLLATALAAGMWRLGRRARSWPSAVVAGREVLVSDDFGPALVGILWPRIVVPRWALGLGAERVGMACLHEAEHRRTGDTLVLLASALAIVAAPWNLALWWIHARLRTAVEMDCDRRVLAAGVHPVAYGSLLLEMGTRARGVPAMVAGLARPLATLERRMTMIVQETERAGPGGYGRVTLSLAGAALLVAVACETPAPTAVPPEIEQEGALFEAAEVAGEATRSEEAAGALVRLRGQNAIYRLRERSVEEGARQPLEFPAGVNRMRFDVGPRETAADREREIVRLGRLEGSVDAMRPAPIVFVDGIRLDGSAVGTDGEGGTPESVLDRLDPGDIERIEILKGGAAEAVYGEEAAAGVIHIFTKSGTAPH